MSKFSDMIQGFESKEVPSLFSARVDTVEDTELETRVVLRVTDTTLVEAVFRKGFPYRSGDKVYFLAIPCAENAESLFVTPLESHLDYSLGVWC